MKHSLLVELDLTRYGWGYQRLTSSPIDLIYGGNLYTASGDLIGIGDTENSVELSSKGITISLSGIDPSYQDAIEAHAFLNAPVRVDLAFTPEGTNVVQKVVAYHRGTADTPQTSVDYENGEITIALSTYSLFGSLDKTPSLSRSSFSTHQARHSGDLFYQYAGDSQLGEETWQK